MTESPSAHAEPAPPPAPAAPPTSAWTVSDRFFSWVRGLGVVRADGWLGGVCAGIAARLRIDAAIVRGIVAVAAVLGFPMLLLYAIAWALLPDASGRIHFQDLLRGRFDPAMVGIGILLVVSFVPAVPWIGSLLVPSWLYAGWSPAGIVLTILGLALVVGVVILIARASAREQTPGDSATTPRTASADMSPSGAAAGSVGSGAAAAFSSDASAPPAEPALFRAPADAADLDATMAPAPEPIAPPQGSADADIAAWRAQHDAWRAHNDAWRRQQKDADRLAREQARAERAATGAAFTVEANELRRVERMSRPRTSAAYVVAALGAALVVGAIAALANSSAATMLAAAIGLFAAALVLALALVLAGVLRRRSGFLTFATVLVLVGATASAITPPVIAEAAALNMWVGNVVYSGPVVQRAGHLFIDIEAGEPEPAPMMVTKADGDTLIQVWEGAELSLRGALGGSRVSLQTMDMNTGVMTDERIAPDAVNDVYALPDAAILTRQILQLDQDRGTVTIRLLTGSGADAAPTASPEPIGTPSPTSSPIPLPTPEVTP